MNAKRNFAVLVLAGGLMIGCSSQPEKPKPQPAAAPVKPDPRSDARALRDRAQELMNESRQLPGRTEEEHLQLVQSSLEDISALLHALAGNEPPGDLRQQLRNVDDYRKRLANMTPDMASEPTIDTALRATHQSLQMISRDRFATHNDIQQLIDRLAAKTRELDAARGPLHRLVVGQTIDLAAQTIQRMAAVEAEKIGA